MDAYNLASAWRRQIAGRIAALYAGYPNAACVVLGGSTARGHADRFSDIEIGVFWNAPPAEEERQSAARRASPSFRLYEYDPSEEVWADDLIIMKPGDDPERNGVLVEVVHYTTGVMNRTLREVLEEYNPDLGKQNLVSAVVDGISLGGDGLLQEWQRAAAKYPDGLARAVIERHGVIDHFWRWQMLLERGDNRMLLYQMFSQVEQQVLLMLLALNRTYFFGFKWIDVVLSKLAIAPENLGDRLKAPFALPPGEGAEMLSGLVEETFDLVERQMPEIDTNRLRSFFRYRRPFLTAPLIANKP